MFEEEKRDIKGSTGSLNVKYAYKEPAIKQAVTSTLSRASHFSSGPVRLSFSADLGCAYSTDTQTSLEGDLPRVSLTADRLGLPPVLRHAKSYQAFPAACLFDSKSDRVALRATL